MAERLHLLAAGVWGGGLVWLLAGLIGHSRHQEPSETTTADTVARVQAVLASPASRSRWSGCSP